MTERSPTGGLAPARIRARPASERAEQTAAARQPRSESTERFGKSEPAPYHGWCGACQGWYFRGAETRWHFLSNGTAHREHVQCDEAAKPRRDTTFTHKEALNMAGYREALATRRQAIQEGTALAGFRETDFERAERVVRGALITWELSERDGTRASLEAER